MAAVVDTCNFDAPTGDVVICELLQWVRNLLSVYSKDRCAKLIIAFASSDLLVSIEKQVTEFIKGKGVELHALPKIPRKEVTASDYVGCHKVAIRLMETVTWLVDNGVRVCGEATKFPHVSFGVTSAGVQKAYVDAITTVSGMEGADAVNNSLSKIQAGIDGLERQMGELEGEIREQAVGLKLLRAPVEQVSDLVDEFPPLPTSGAWSPLNLSSNPSVLAQITSQPPVAATPAVGRPTAPWQLVSRAAVANSKRSSAVIGVGKSDKLKGVPQSLTLSVKRISLDTSENDLKGYMTDMGATPTYVSILPKKWDTQLSAMAKVVVSHRDKDKVLQPSFWPEGYIVKEWFFKPYNASY